MQNKGKQYIIVKNLLAIALIATLLFSILMITMIAIEKNAIPWMVCEIIGFFFTVALFITYRILYYKSDHFFDIVQQVRLYKYQKLGEKKQNKGYFLDNNLNFCEPDDLFKGWKKIEDEKLTIYIKSKDIREPMIPKSYDAFVLPKELTPYYDYEHDFDLLSSIKQQVCFMLRNVIPNPYFVDILVIFIEKAMTSNKILFYNNFIGGMYQLYSNDLTSSANYQQGKLDVRTQIVGPAPIERYRLNFCGIDKNNGRVYFYKQFLLDFEYGVDFSKIIVRRLKLRKCNNRQN